MKRVFDLNPGDELWLYIWEPMEECFPVLEKRFVINCPVANLTEFYLVNENGKEERHVIKVLDSGVNASVKGKYYIWMTERNLKKAYELIRDYFMKRLCKATDEIQTLTKIFSNMEGWADCMEADGDFTHDWDNDDFEEDF